MTPLSGPGVRMLRGALGVVATFAVAVGGWIAWQALRHPDVRARRPRWLNDAEGFDAAFWSPLLLTVVTGSLLVAAVFWTAYRRMRAGEDLYAGRLGKGLRRRGERGFADEEDKGGPGLKS